MFFCTGVSRYQELGVCGKFANKNRRNRNVLQMSIAIVTVFVFCWLPNVNNFLIIYYQDSSTLFSCSFWLYFVVTVYMANAYCAINPVICFMFSSNYRKALKRLIKCSFCTGVGGKNVVLVEELRVRGSWNTRE